MVANIETPHSVLRALNYNENKVKMGKAEFIHAENYLKDSEQLKFYDKLERLNDLISLNDATTNVLHISINFHPSEVLSKDKLAEISRVYMDKIGFGNQPFLVYQHFDAAHPHVHVLTTNIQPDGRRISTHNLGRNQSVSACREIEQLCGLFKADGKQKQERTEIKPVNAQKVKYGISETKRSIINVLDAVIDKYKYASLPELNSILKQYNVMADSGNENGRIFRHKGLTYRILDTDGNKMGVPIKASSIYSKPTLAYLEDRFRVNERLRAPDKHKLKNAIEWTLRKNPMSLADFLIQLKKERITGVVHRNKEGFVYGLTFIDHRSKSVFNGSDIGKTYSAAAIQQRIAKGGNQKENNIAVLLQKQNLGNSLLEKKEPPKKRMGNLSDTLQKDKSKSDNTIPKIGDLLELLLKSDKNDNRIPYELLRRKKKKRNPLL